MARGATATQDATQGEVKQLRPRHHAVLCIFVQMLSLLQAERNREVRKGYRDLQQDIISELRQLSHQMVPFTRAYLM